MAPPQDARRYAGFIAFVTALMFTGCREHVSSSVESEQWDFGEVQIDSGAVTVTHDFVLQNVTSKDLEIVELVTSCGCVGVDVPKMSLAAGDTLSVTVGLKFVEPGPQQHSLRVFLSDGSRRLFELRGKGVRRTDLRAVLTDYSSDLVANGQLLLIHTKAHDARSIPVLLEPLEAGISLEAGSWVTVSEADEQDRRSGRRVCEFSLRREVARMKRPTRIRIGVGAQVVEIVWP